MLAAVGRRRQDEAAEQHGPGGPAGPGGGQSLVGTGASRVGIGGAMRARDVSRVRPEDLAEAERDVRIRHAAPVTPPARRPHAPVPQPPPRSEPHAGGS